MASTCRPNSRRTTVAGCYGRSGPATGDSAPNPRRKHSLPLPPQSPPANPSPSAPLADNICKPGPCCPTRSAWWRCRATMPGCAMSGPTFVVNERGELRGVDWVFNAWGGISGGLYFPWDQDDLVARKVLEIEGCDRYRAPAGDGGRRHPCRRRRHADHDRGMPAQPASQSAAGQGPAGNPVARIPGRDQRHLARQRRGRR